MRVNLSDSIPSLTHQKKGPSQVAFLLISYLYLNSDVYGEKSNCLTGMDVRAVLLPPRTFISFFQS